MNPIYAQALYDLVTLKKHVDPWELTAVAESMYKNVKVVGIDDTCIKYTDAKNGTETFLKGNQISEEMRAVAAFIVTLIYRWNDNYSGRLETHFGLSTSIHFIIGGGGISNIYSNNNAALDCINVKSFIDAYLAV